MGDGLVEERAVRTDEEGNDVEVNVGRVLAMVDRKAYPGPRKWAGCKEN